MDEVVFGSFTVRDLLIAGGAVVGLIILIGILKRVFGGKGESAHTEAVRCVHCGWQGRVSRYAGRCPKCNQPLGERRAKPPTR